MPFSDPITAGNVLIRDAIQSPDYVTGVSGWAIKKDGTAEFLDAVLRGIVQVVGSSGARIVLEAAGYPSITFYSPDGTNEAFINLVTGAGDQAQLGINSGKFDPGDGIERYWRIFAADNQIIQSIVKEVNQSTAGAWQSLSVDNHFIGWRDADAGEYNYLVFGNDGSAQFVRDTYPEPLYLRNGDRVIPTGALVNRKDDSAVALSGPEVMDTGIGAVNTSFTAWPERTYRVRYNCRLQAGAAATAGDVRIRDSYDGTAAPPVPGTGDTLLAAASVYLHVAGGAGGTALEAVQTLDCPGDIPAGVHRLAAFYARTAGGATVQVSQASGAKRELTVEDIGSTA